MYDEWTVMNVYFKSHVQYLSIGNHFTHFYCIFFLMKGLRFGWAIVLFGRDYPGPFFIVIGLIWFFIHIQKLSGLNTKGLNVNVIINEQTMTISPLY